MPETKRDEHWCPTCGKTNSDDNDCPVCAQWWKDNPPPASKTKRDEGLEAARWAWECLREKLPKDINPRAIERIDDVLRAAPVPQSQDARDLVKQAWEEILDHFAANNWRLNEGVVLAILARLSAPAEKTVPITPLRLLYNMAALNGSIRNNRDEIITAHMAEFGLKVTED